MIRRQPRDRLFFFGNKNSPMRMDFTATLWSAKIQSLRTGAKEKLGEGLAGVMLLRFELNPSHLE